MSPPLVGVLALQGGFQAHIKALERAGARGLEIRSAAELERVERLILPGGESTTMLKLLGAEGLLEPLRRFGERSPVFGTCAGAILLARRVTGPAQESLGLMDMDVERNAYGRQLDSRVVRLSEAEGGPLEAVFIRAPAIRRVGPGVRVLVSHGGDPVLVEDGLHLAATFHPELTADPGVHRLFLEKRPA